MAAQSSRRLARLYLAAPPTSEPATDRCAARPGWLFATAGGQAGSRIRHSMRRRHQRALRTQRKTRQAPPKYCAMD
jgi:hypothetical protein